MLCVNAGSGALASEGRHTQLRWWDVTHPAVSFFSAHSLLVFVHANVRYNVAGPGVHSTGAGSCQMDPSDGEGNLSELGTDD